MVSIQWKQHKRQKEEEKYIFGCVFCACCFFHRIARPTTSHRFPTSRFRFGAYYFMCASHWWDEVNAIYAVHIALPFDSLALNYKDVFDDGILGACTHCTVKPGQSKIFKYWQSIVNLCVGAIDNNRRHGWRRQRARISYVNGSQFKWTIQFIHTMHDVKWKIKCSTLTAMTIDFFFIKLNIFSSMVSVCANESLCRNRFEYWCRYNRYILLFVCIFCVAKNSKL